MTVKRIVANLEAAELPALRAFYVDVLGLEVVMDQAWIVTLAGTGAVRPQLSLAREGGSGLPVPHLSIEVDDLDAVMARVSAAGHPIVYGPTREPWGVRRFFLHDPAGRLLNVLVHE